MAWSLTNEQRLQYEFSLYVLLGLRGVFSVFGLNVSIFLFLQWIIRENKVCKDLKILRMQTIILMFFIRTHFIH